MKRDNMTESHSTTNLIINNIPASASDQQLSDLFCKFGQIKSYKVIRHNEKDGKTYGFCEYIDPKCATIALRQLDNYRINDRLLRVAYAKLFPKPKGKSVGVGNIPKFLNEDVIRKYFSQFGRISRMRLKSSESGCDNKLAEIIFDSKVDACKACYEPERFIPYESRTIQVSVYMIQEECDVPVRKGVKRDYIYNYCENEAMHQQQGLYDMNYVCMLKPANPIQPMSQAGSILQHSQGHNMTGVSHAGISPNTAYSSPYTFDMNALQTALIYQQNPAAFCHNQAATGINNGNTATIQYAAAQQFSPGYYSFPAQGIQGSALPVAAVPQHQQYMTWATAPQTHIPTGTAHYYSQHQTHALEHGSAQVIGGGGSSGSSTTVNTGSNGGNSSNSSGHTASYFGPTIPAHAYQAASMYQQQHPHIQAPSQHHIYQAQTNNMGGSVSSNNHRNSYYKPPSVAGGPHMGNGTIVSGVGAPSNNIGLNQVASRTSRPSSNSPPMQQNTNQHQQQSINDSSSIQQHVVYVYNIGNNTNREQMKDLFSSPQYANDIIKIDIPRDACLTSAVNSNGLLGGNNKNFCFITFSNFQAAESAISEMNGKDFQGKVLQVSFKK